MMTVEVKGLSELSRDMKALGPKIALKALRGALVAGAGVVKKDVIARVPVKTGTLKKAVYIKRMTKQNPFAERVIVGIRHGRGTWKKKDGQVDKSNDAFYWKFLEFGTKFISRQNFVVNSFESKKDQALTKIKEVLTRKIAQIVREK